MTFDPPSSVALKEIKDTNNSFRTLEFLIKDQQHFRAESAFVHADSWIPL